MSNQMDWNYTSKGDSRGYIQPQMLKELWFHTGTVCNLNCPFCLEGSSPVSRRIESLRFEDAVAFIDEAEEMGVEKYSFTGGEPFLNADIIKILEYVLERKPCLVLTNATDPLRKKLSEVKRLNGMANQLSLRVSLDYPDRQLHDAGRGEGHFIMAIETMKGLHAAGVGLSIARQYRDGENTDEVMQQYNELLQDNGLPDDMLIVAFVDLLLPESNPDVPEITENCMTTYKTQEQREAFMCNFSKMIVKQNGKVGVYACTLVDDDKEYDLGRTLKESMGKRVMLRHHRCFACFSSGTSCSEG